MREGEVTYKLPDLIAVIQAESQYLLLCRALHHGGVEDFWCSSILRLAKNGPQVPRPILTRLRLERGSASRRHLEWFWPTLRWKALLMLEWVSVKVIPWWETLLLLEQTVRANSNSLSSICDTDI
ncbi:hypothetical protein AcV5_003829 [Taiwanofungus camphoratus]|nr:hypothetical protein AcV5_003829 [Antrodia cinnamomea]